LHAKVAIDALHAGKHVLTEKLMAHNVAQCKLMGRVAKQKNMVLTVGHQRHYSVLYDNAVNLLKWGVLGELHHIRAQWHRGNLPGNDSWQQPLPPVDDLRQRISERMEFRRRGGERYADRKRKRILLKASVLQSRSLSGKPGCSIRT
jgi:hypothetical protein